MSTETPRQTILIDADDTLWENNIYFERAIAEFTTFLNHGELTPAQVREVLNEVERENVVRHGYGLKSFTHALANTFERISVGPLTPELRATIQGFAHKIAVHPIEMIRGVEPTLGYLRQRHSLLLVTKGNFEEQTGKVERSGLKHYFAAVEVVPEKNEAAYSELAGKYELDRAATWMVGNSPRSDINPALAAGLNAVFVPHADTWVLEHEALAEAQPPQRLLCLESFADLQEHF